jgi:hypothetical protein
MTDEPFALSPDANLAGQVGARTGRRRRPGRRKTMTNFVTADARPQAIVRLADEGSRRLCGSPCRISGARRCRNRRPDPGAVDRGHPLITGWRWRRQRAASTACASIGNIATLRKCASCPKRNRAASPSYWRQQRLASSDSGTQGRAPSEQGLPHERRALGDRRADRDGVRGRKAR